MTTKRRALALGVVVGLAAGATLVAANPVSATFPGKNGKIVFASAISGNNEIYVMQPDGGDVKQLTNNPDSERGASWSADGKRIVYVRNTNGAQEDIWVMNADGSGQTQLTNTPDDRDQSPHFSPDGETIVFGSDRAGDFEIFAMDDDGSNVRQLTNNTVDDSGPRFSPDGKRIVFASGSPASDIWVMHADGSDQRPLTTSPFNETSADYSPDGEKILFVSNAAGGAKVFVMDAEGSDQRKLTDTGVDFGAHFSPDGERIVFTSQRDGGTNNVFEMNADGSDQTNITHNPAQDLGPDWQPLEVDGDVTVTKWVNGTPPQGATYDVKVVCDNGDDEFTKSLTFGEAGGTQSVERESFGPLECEVTEPNTGGATTVEIACANAKNAECGDEPGHFVLFDDPGDDKTKIEINVTNTFPVTAEPTFTG